MLKKRPVWQCSPVGGVAVLAQSCSWGRTETQGPFVSLQMADCGGLPQVVQVRNASQLSRGI